MKIEVLAETAAPVPLFPPQISHVVAWHWTRASAVSGWRLTPSDMARLSQNESSCEKNRHGTPKPCPNDHITSMSHVSKIERGIFRTRLHKTPHIHSFLRFTENRNKLSLAEAVHIKLNVTSTWLHDLPKWSRHFSL